MLNALAPRAPYDESKDIIFYHDQPTSYVDLLPGDFVILFPEDGHAPFVGDGSPISKLIVKVRRIAKPVHIPVEAPSVRSRIIAILA